MPQHRHPRDSERMNSLEKRGFDRPRHNLRRSHDHAREQDLRRVRTAHLQQPRQMRRQRARDEPGRRKREREQPHVAIHHHGGGRRRRVSPRRPQQTRQDQQIERQAEQNMRRSPAHAGRPPAERIDAPRRQRPADRARKAGEQRNAGDRPARLLPIDPAERCERGVVEPEPHPCAHDEPAEPQHWRRGRKRQRHQPRREQQIRYSQHLAPAEEIDRAADAWAQQRRHQQRAGERGIDHARRCSDICRLRPGDERDEIVARRPRERLRGAEPQHDTGLLPVPARRRVVRLAHRLLVTGSASLDRLNAPARGLERSRRSSSRAARRAADATTRRRRSAVAGTAPGTSPVAC